MADVAAGVVGFGEITGGSRVAGSGMDTDTPAFWTTAIAAGAGLFLLFLFFAGRR